MFKNLYTKLSKITKSNYVVAGTMLVKRLQETTLDILSLDRRLKAIERYTHPAELMREELRTATFRLGESKNLPNRLDSVETKLRVLNELINKEAKEGTLLMFHRGTWENWTSSNKNMEKRLNSIKSDMLNEVENVIRSVNERVKDIKNINTKIKNIEKKVATTPRRKSRSAKKS